MWARATFHQFGVGIRLAIFALVVAAFPISATTPFPLTFVVKDKHDQWTLKGGYLGGAAIVVKDGEKERLRAHIHDLIPKTEHRHVQDSTAGPIWARCALCYFPTLDGKPHFCVRTHWNRRILINLATFRHVSDTRFRDQLSKHEIRIAKSTLADGVRQMEARIVVESESSVGLLAALHLARVERLKETAPLLKQLEKVDDRGCILVYPEIIVHENLPARRMVQLCLRCMGETPAGLPCNAVELDGQRLLKHVPRRADHADKIELSMTKRAVIDRLGSPDYLMSRWIRATESDEAIWRYDMDGKAPFTLLVFLSEQGLVTRVERFEPWFVRGDELVAQDKRPFFEIDGEFRADIQFLYSEEFKSKVKMRKGPVAN